MSVINTRSFGRFRPVSWTITHRFGVPERFPWLLNPKVRLRVGHEHSPFWTILARFMGYCSPFWGPRAISTIDEPRRTFTCRSRTLAVLPDSGPFHGLLLTVLAPGAISMVAEPQDVLTCWSSTLADLADSGPSHGLLLTALRSRSDIHD